VVELSSVQVEDVENPHSGPTTASTTNSTFNYGRDILPTPEELPYTGTCQLTAKNEIPAGSHRVSGLVQLVLYGDNTE